MQGDHADRKWPLQIRDPYIQGVLTYKGPYRQEAARGFYRQGAPTNKGPLQTLCNFYKQGVLTLYKGKAARDPTDKDPYRTNPGEYATLSYPTNKLSAFFTVIAINIDIFKLFLPQDLIKIHFKMHQIAEFF